MNTERFFELFFKELEDNKNLYPYYKLTEGSLKQQAFRKEYFLQRLNFIKKNIHNLLNFLFRYISFFSLVLDLSITLNWISCPANGKPISNPVRYYY